MCIPNKIPDFILDEEIRDIIRFAQPYTKTSPLNIYNCISAIKYIVENQIPGDIVECGVWKGGSMMAAAKTLKMYQDHSRKIHLFDTFEGMTEPTKEDINTWGISATEKMRVSNKSDSNSVWCYSSLDEVKRNMQTTKYNNENILYIKGRVEDTLTDKHIPDKISLLRLDTDWYASTKIELEKLWPQLSIGGFIIIDDYGHWKGARKATDEYFKTLKHIPFISIDGPLIGIKIKE